MDIEQKYTIYSHSKELIVKKLNNLINIKEMDSNNLDYISIIFYKIVNFENSRLMTLHNNNQHDEVFSIINSLTPKVSFIH